MKCDIVKIRMGEKIKRVLFMPDCNGLAHSGRMLKVAQALRERFDGVIEAAGSGKYGNLFSEAGFTFHEIEDPTRKMRLSYRKNLSLFHLNARVRESLNVCRKLIESELQLFQVRKPDLVIWDGQAMVRGIAGEVFGVPSIFVMNAHLTPYSALQLRFPTTLSIFFRLPWLSFVTKLPEDVQHVICKRLRKVGFSYFVKVINTLRDAFHLKPFSCPEDFFKGLQALIMPDLEIMSPVENPPANFHYIGPLIWEPRMELPDALKTSSDIIYVTMGSTGNPQLFKLLIETFSRMPEVKVVMTIADLVDVENLKPLPETVSLYPYLPGAEMAKRARLVICHGGLGSIYQALSQGVPIIGIPFTPGQEIGGIDLVEAVGAGLKLSGSGLTPLKIAHAVREVLEHEKYRIAARTIAAHIRLEDGPKRAADIISREVSQARCNAAQGDRLPSGMGWLGAQEKSR